MIKEIQLRPIRETTEDYDRLEKAIRDLLKKELYLPLMKLLGEPSKALTNSADDLLDAIRTGRIAYDRGKFTGRFNSSISKELKSLGAEWDRRQGSWKIPKSSLPLKVRNAISASVVYFEKKLKRIDEQLSQLLPEEIADKLQASKFFDASLWKVDQDFKSSLRGITVAPQLSDEARQRIADEWQTNLKLYVKDFTQEEILKLRKGIQKNVFTGNRYESTVKTIQKSYGVTENKAKFLARQETALLMAKFKETRYADAGVEWYRWGCVHMPKDKSPGQHTPGNVRFHHAELDGKKFRWDDPPIVDEKGNRKNPGQDYNCRCFAKPIVQFKSKA